MGQEGPLQVDRRCSAGARRVEHSKERVALGVDLLAAVRGKAGPDQPMMIGKHFRVSVAQARQQRCRTFDIGEEKGERLRGQQPKTSIRRGTLNAANGKSQAPQARRT